MKEMSRYLDTSIGSYRLTKLIGAGPVSCVYLAERQDRVERQIVLKLFEAVPFASLEEKDQTLDEIRLLACLEHPAILPTLDDGLHENILYLVTPYIEAGSLRQRLTAAAGELFPLKETMALLRQVGDALQCAHRQQIVHANIKPENILFQHDGTVLLADFLLPSLVKSERAARIFSTFAAYYMAPEQFQGQVTPLSDQYALACLAYELLTGQPPFEADNLMRLALKHATDTPQLPSRLQPRRVQYLDHVLLKALAKQPQERYPDVQAFLAELSAPPPLVAQVATPDTSPGVVQSSGTALDPALAALLAETVTPPQLAYPLSIAVFEQETSKQQISPQAYPLSVMGFEREPLDPPVSPPAPPQPDADVEQEEAEQNAPLVLSELDAVDMHSAVTIRISPDAASVGQPTNIVYAPSQQVILQARTRALARLSRGRIFLLASLVALVMVVSLAGVIMILGASSATHTPQVQPGGKVFLLSPTTSSGQTQPGATSTGRAASSPMAAATPTGITTRPGATSTPGAALGLSCRVDYQLSSSWPGGFVANIVITNTGKSAIQGWTLVFTFSGGERVTNGWNGRFTQNGAQVSIANAAYNASLASGTTVAPGFQASSPGGNNTPTGFALNGVACN